MEQKKELIYEVSSHRTTSSRELTYSEVHKLIDYCEDISGTDRMRRKVFALAYAAGIIYGHTDEDKKMNNAKLNKFLLERGAVKKELNHMSKEELNKTVNQFAAIVKHNEEAQHNKEVKTLLNNLNIHVK
ncbi:MAG TPA: hypothetical protein DGG95_01990 [Cytophagales bacterium]|nr:hypothetical protein [Cytophagales bacterium]